VATGIDSLGRLDARQALARHADEIRDLHLRDLFAGDGDRGERLAIKAEDVYLDYSKNRVTDQTLRLLVQLADERGLRQRIDAMFAGDAINPTEDRAVLHVALRAPVGSRIEVDGADVVAAVRDVLHDSSTNALIRRYRRHRNGAVLKEA
jgi:glucose-6-phosphate isomerase